MIRNYLLDRRREARFAAIREAHRLFGGAPGEEALIASVCGALCMPGGFRHAAVAEMRPDGSLRPIGSAVAEGATVPESLPVPKESEPGKRSLPTRAKAGKGCAVALPVFVEGGPSLVLTVVSSDFPAFEGVELEDFRSLAARLGESVESFRLRGRLAALREGYDRLVAQREAESDLADRVLRLVATPVVRLGPDGEIRLFNRRMESLTGYSASEVLNRRMADLLIPEAARSSFRRTLVELFMGRRHDGTPFPLLSRGGTPIVVAWDFDAVRGEGGKVSSILACGTIPAVNGSE